MQFNITTDYGIRAVLLLALTRDRLSIATIADKMHIPKSYLPSIMKKLAERDMVAVERGVSGGWKLARKPDQITLFDMIDALEPTTRINRCLEPDHYCNRTSPEYCSVHHQYVKLQHLIEGTLQGVTVEQLLRESDALKEFQRLGA